MMKLHIGCKGEHIKDFKRVDVVQHGDIDYVRDAKDLSCFEDNSVDEIYASHIIEHFRKTEVMDVLKEWNRVLKPGGILWVSVPNFDSVVDMYLKSGRMLTAWMDHLIHGDQSTNYDFHYNIFTYNNISYLLLHSGFKEVEKLARLPYDLSDASVITDSVYKIPISINLKAVK